MQGVGIPVSANSSKSLMNQKCAARSRFTKSGNKHKKRVESVDEANAFSHCFGKNIVLNLVLCCNCHIIACKDRKSDYGNRFPDNRGTVTSGNAQI